MKEFQPQEILGLKNYLDSNAGVRLAEIEVGENNFPYYVIPQAINPSLPDFALRMTHTDPETREVTGIFGVSDSVPEALQAFWVMHEIIEFTQIGIETQGRCAQAEEQVVAAIPEDLRSGYIERRITFFESLLQFFSDDIQSGANNYTEDDVHEAEASLNFLIGIS